MKIYLYNQRIIDIISFPFIMKYTISCSLYGDILLIQNILPLHTLMVVFLPFLLYGMGILDIGRLNIRSCSTVYLGKFLLFSSYIYSNFHVFLMSSIASVISVIACIIFRWLRQRRKSSQGIWFSRSKVLGRQCNHQLSCKHLKCSEI